MSSFLVATGLPPTVRPEPVEGLLFPFARQGKAALRQAQSKRKSNWPRSALPAAGRGFLGGCFLGRMARRRLLRGRLLGRTALVLIGCAGALFGIAKAPLQRGHQVDDVRALGGRRVRIGIFDDPLALGALLLLDQPVKRIDIAVVE